MIGARIHDRETARDLAQDALVAAIAALRAGSLREPDRLAAFVLGIGRNLANNYIRRRQSGPIEVPLDPDSIVARADPDTQDRERREIAARALRALPAADRQVLGLTLVEGLKPGDIAERLGENVDVIRTRKSRALKKVIAEVARLSRFRLAGH